MTADTLRASVRLAPAAVGVAMLGAGVVGCAAGPSTEPASPVSSPRPSTVTPADPTAEYIDGTYEATGWYGSLPSHQDVTLTLEGDLVTAVTLTTPAENPTSLGHQQRFAEAISAEIVGIDIDTIEIDRLAGASGCSEGFMNALAEIKSAAEA
ncbi:hypothetical protein [Microbacterium sp. KRD172]|uniref:hypothetical protein n=1 Tax=Microbacterium sp. KRD172 TaxID=2729727 RepID=UPI0019D17207|nr:hypothetical protein [Microbacterium sp. KRD172]